MQLSTFFIVIALLLRGSESRLPDDTVPESYVLRLEPDLDAENAPFTGQVDIVIRVKKSTPVIVLNSKDLNLEYVNVTDVNSSQSIPVNSWGFVEDQEQVHVLMNSHILADQNYKISIRFRGLLRDDATGFYKSYYTGNSNQKKWFAATQFQATHARSAFPCYDEPAFKTPFNVSVKRKRNEIALSNMPILNIEDVLEKEFTWVHFNRSSPISTCSVALFVGAFEHLNTDQKNKTNVYSHPDTLNQIKYVTDVAPQLLTIVERYTDVEYALPKLDLMVVPVNATVSPADDWGLNTFREQLLFVDNTTKTKTNVSVTTIVGGTIARQWFGNLVTPIWWDFTWLNLGFGTYFEYFVTATLEPKWRLEDFFVIEKHQVALEYDRTLRRSLSVSVNTPEEIDSMFDEISSDKGAAVLKMLQSWVGEDVFKRAVNIYLTQNRFDVVKPEQLWNAFDTSLVELTKTDFHGNEFHAIMSSWVEQSGYPLVNVKKLYNNNLLLTQERFSNQLSSNINNDDFTAWYIQSSYTTSDDKDFTMNLTRSVWLDPLVNQTICCTVAEDTKWYIFNVQSTGFYRVNYTEDNWLSLIKQLNDTPKDIHVLNRAQLIDDSFNLARAGKLNYKIPLSLIQYLDKEDDVIPWLSAMNNLNFVLNQMRRIKEGYDDVKNFIRKLATIAFQKVDKLVVEQQSHEYTISIGWNAFSMWACNLNTEYCKNMTLNYFQRWQNGQEIPADIKDATFCTAVKYGIDEGYKDKILELYNTTQSYSERESALYALACTTEEYFLQKCLESMLENKSPIERRDYVAFFNALSSTPSGIKVLLFFLKNHFTDIVKKVPEGDNMVNVIYSLLASKVSTESEIKMMSELAFSTDTPVKFRNKFSSVYHTEIEYNENWFNCDNSNQIREFLRPGSTRKTSPPKTTTQVPRKADSSASSTLYGCTVLLCFLAILPSGIWTMLE